MTAVDQPRAHAGATAPGRRPAPPQRRPGRHLRPVERPSRRDLRGGRRTTPAAPVLVGTGIVIVALFTLAAMHALLIGGQIRLDASERAVASETEEIRTLRLRVAELESPGRVLDVARERLGMVEPSEVGYLLPGTVDTGDDDPIRVAPAETPPPPEPEVDEASPDEDAVDTPTGADSGATEAEPDAYPNATGPSGTSAGADERDVTPDAPTAEGGSE